MVKVTSHAKLPHFTVGRLRMRTEASGAAELAPYDAQMIAHLAMIKLMVGEVDKALEWLDSADARDPSGAKVSNYRRGWAYTLQNRNEQAVAALKQGIDYVDTPLLLAVNYVRLGRFDEAKSSVQAALKIDPTFTQTRWRAGYFYSDPSIVEREVTDLAKAGLPEK